MLVRFWGTRGSIPAPGPRTVRYGGNTSCIEVRSGDTLIIMDCGTGARELGASLAPHTGELHAYLFLSHFHWDHIQGFPFFLPAFLAHAQLEVFGPAGMEQGLEDALAGQMQYTYFPVRLEELRSQLTFYEVGEETFQAGAFAVVTQCMNHTCPAIGYRLTAGGATVAYLCDHEPFWPHRPTGDLEDLLSHPAERRHVAFAAGADLLVHDAQYTAEEYPARRGWGHSTIEYVVDVAVAAGVRRLALFHHDPTRSDAALDDLLVRARKQAQARGGDLEILAAGEGDAIELPETGAGTIGEPLRLAPAGAPPARVLILGSRDRRRQVRAVLAADGYRIHEAALGGRSSDWAALDPDLIVVAPGSEGDAVDAVTSVSQALPQRPLVAVLDGTSQTPVLSEVAAVAADVVELPFGGPNLRARVRACLTREHTRARSPGARGLGPEGFSLVDTLAGEFEPLVEAGVRCAFRPGEVLFRQGDPGGGVYYLESGIVQVQVETPDGRQVTAGYGGAGDTVGEMSALDGSARSASVVAQEPVQASYIPAEAFRDALRRSPEAAMRLLTLLVRRLRATDALLADMAQGAGSLGEPASTDRIALLQRKIEQLQARLEQLGLTPERLGRDTREAPPGGSPPSE